MTAGTHRLLGSDDVDKGPEGHEELFADGGDVRGAEHEAVSGGGGGAELVRVRVLHPIQLEEVVSAAGS